MTLDQHKKNIVATAHAFIDEKIFCGVSKKEALKSLFTEHIHTYCQNNVITESEKKKLIEHINNNIIDAISEYCRNKSTPISHHHARKLWKIFKAEVIDREENPNTSSFRSNLSRSQIGRQLIAHPQFQLLNVWHQYPSLTVAFECRTCHGTTQSCLRWLHML